MDKGEEPVGKICGEHLYYTSTLTVMGGGVSMDHRTLVWILLIGSMAYGNIMCEVVEDGDISKLIINTVYREDGIHPFSSITTNSQEGEQIDVDSMVLVDGEGRAYDVEVGKEAAPVENTILGGSYYEGPFVVTYLLSDTLRIAKVGVHSYGEGALLRERFEGTYGISLYETLKNIAKNIKEFVFFVNEQTPPINNVINAENFSASVVCASSSCKKELYSLLTKYMNLGASSEMAVEFLNFKFVIGPAKRAAEGALALGKISVPESKFVEGLKNKLRALNFFGRKQLEEAKNLFKGLSDGEKEAIKGILDSPSEWYAHTGKLSLQGKTAAYIFTKELKNVKFEKLIVEEGGKKYLLVNKLEEAIKNMEEFGKKVGDIQSLTGSERLKEMKQLADSVKKTLEQIKNNVKNKNIEKIPLKELASQLKGKVKLEDLEKIKQLREMLDDYSSIVRNLEDKVPLVLSQADLIGDEMERMLSKESGSRTGRALVAKGVATPLMFYLTRTTPLPPDVTFEGINSNLSKIFPVKRAYQIPSSWTTMDLKPSNMEGVFMDVLIGHGSDPGNIFRSILTILPIGLIDRVITSVTGSNPLDIVDMIPDPEDEELYRMKDAVVMLATTNNCQTCYIEDGKSFSGPKLFLSLTENQREKSTLITFFRRMDLIADGKRLIDTSNSENLCSQKCFLVRNMTEASGKEPFAALFLHGLLIGYVVPSFGGLTLTLIISAATSPVFADCFTCTDTTFGYYLHVLSFSPPKEEEPMPVDKVKAAVEQLGVDIKQVEEWISSYKKGEIEKQRSMLYSTLTNAKGKMEGLVISIWTKPSFSMPTRFKGGVELSTEDGEKLRIDETTVTSKDGSVTAPGAGISTVETEIPGMIVPTNLSRVNLSSISLEVTSQENYIIGEALQQCLSVEPGRIKLVKAEKGSIKVEEDGLYVTSDDYVGPASKITVENGIVRATVTDITPEGITQKDIELGKLISIVFERVSVVSKGDSAYVWNKGDSVPQESVEDADLETDGESVSLSITPSSDATREEVKTIDKGEEMLDDIQAIDASKTTVAIREGKDGEQYLTIYNKEDGSVTNEKIVDMKSENGELVVTTVDEKGNEKVHRIRLEVTSDGTPTLKVDGKDGGIVKTVQSKEGFMWYNPKTGEWNFVNGVLAPLSEAFKEGMKIAFEGGKAVAKPSGNIIVNAPPSQGMSLPSLGEWILPLLAIVILLMLYQGSRQ